MRIKIIIPLGILLLLTAFTQKEEPTRTPRMIYVDYWYALNSFYEPVYDEEYFGDKFLEWYSSEEAKEIKSRLDALEKEMEEHPDATSSDIYSIHSLNDVPNALMDTIERMNNGEEFPEIKNSLFRALYDVNKHEAQNTIHMVEEQFGSKENAYYMKFKDSVTIKDALVDGPFDGK